MFKSITTKIFVAFTAIILIQTIGLSLFYARVILRESENFALETLSKRAENHAVEVASRLKQGEPLKDLEGRGPAIANENGQVFNLNVNFRPTEIHPLLPTSGSLVSVCRSIDDQPYYCALSSITGVKLWAIEVAARTTLLAVIRSLAKEIGTVTLIAIAFALFMSFFLSRFLLGPLRQFSKAAGHVAQGHYENLELPLGRSDEIGAFARAFDRMINDLKERERNIALSSIKISHSSRLASLGQMGASIAHEVKNPLTSMIGYAKVLKSKISEPQLQEAAGIIQHEGERCNQILQQMLRFARNDPEERRAYSVNEVIQSCLLLLKSEAKTNQHSLQSELKDDVILMGSPQQVQQVVINLLMNAMQASPKGSTIKLTAEVDDHWMRLQISDQGAGIPKSIQNRVFDPFFTTKKGSEGTGLGLSVAKEIIQDQGGELTFLSEEGHGTTFTIKLPLPAELGKMIS